MNLQKYNHFISDDKIHYSGNLLLSKMDKNGNKPETYISTSNRSAGKTTWFGGYLLNKFLTKNELFCILMRKKYQLEKAVSFMAYFPSALSVYYPDLEMKEEVGIKGVFNNIYIRLRGKENEWFLCGYSTALNSSDDIRNFSNVFNNVTRIWLDEFQPESGDYVKDEVKRVFSIHTSLARGCGLQSRYLPLILTGNLIDVNNPYYEHFGINRDINIETNFYRGNGFILEQGFNKKAADAHLKSTFNQSFSESDYSKLLTKKEYLKDDNTMILKSPNLKGDYLFTIKYCNKYFSIRYLYGLGFYYVNETADLTYNFALAARKEDLSDDCIFDGDNRFKKRMKKMYHNNIVRFSSYKAREAFTEFIK